ncbi:MAG: hypothetical protein HC840_00795 [Leptolyngbyaceae cyanobacterium RM2_2_4]|nr:hypothetical protein [Leptolyngbyaceae cyanobacterium RM2_2_4]
MNMKRCCTCKENKYTNEFGKLVSSKDGFRPDCKQCRKEYYLNNSEQLKIKQVEYSRNSPNKKKEWHLENKEKDAKTKQEWYQKNSEKSKANNREWRKFNKSKHNAKIAKYRADKLLATPQWLNESQKAEIQKIYDSCPIGYHVDHISPLRGRNSSGLHVPWNLQHLPAEANLKKSNKVV